MSLPEEQIECTTLQSATSYQSMFEISALRCHSLSRLLTVIRKVCSVLNLLDRKRQESGTQLASRPPFSNINKQNCLNIAIIDCQKYYESQKPPSNLSPFKDHDGFWRVGGRLKHSSLPYEGKYPIIIPKNSRLATLIVQHYHQIVIHQGRIRTLNAIRTDGYFIEGARNLVNKVIHSCLICQFLRGKPCAPRMADLPPERLEECPPFTHVGMVIYCKVPTESIQH